MYKLLLVTDREEIKQVFLNIRDWQMMMFHPVTIIEDVQEAINYLETNAVDAVGYSVRGQDVSPLHQYLTEVRPSLSIFQTHKHDSTLRQELNRIRSFMDQLRADYCDTDYDEEHIRQYLKDEIIQQLLNREMPSAEELKSRLKLVRSQLAPDKPCFLFDFDMPQGEVYLQDRWHYGRERLENALRVNFFGRYYDDIFYGVAVLTPRHIRLVAFQRQDAPEEALAQVEARVQQRVQKVIADVKEYLDLDLDLEQYTILDNVYALVAEPQSGR